MCTANGCLPEGCGPGMPGPYKAAKTGTPALAGLVVQENTCGPVSLLLIRFYAFLKPTLCMNLTKAA